MREGIYLLEKPGGKLTLLSDEKLDRSRSRLLAPFGYKNRIVHPSGENLPNVRGGAVTASGMFLNNWMDAAGARASVAFNYLSTHNRCAMFTNTITPVFSDTTLSHLGYGGAGGQYAANEVTGTGYSAGGAGDASASGTFSTPTLTESPTGTIMFDATDAVWTTSTISAARCALVYDNILTLKSAYVLINFGADFATSAGTFTIQWSASGIFTWAVHA